MKGKIAPVLIFSLLVLFTPALALIDSEGGAPDAGQAAISDGGLFEETAPDFILYDEGSDAIITLGERDYLIGAVASEMPALYELEALKAQAVATRSYALYVRALRERTPDTALKGAHIKVNVARYEGYITEAQMKSLWGASYSVYYENIRRAVDETAGLAALYGGAPICACYHAISPGRTEDSGNIFATTLPYLVSVDCSFDKNADGYMSSAAFSSGELSGALGKSFGDFTASGDPASWLGEAEKTAAGTVLALEICGKAFSGAELRTALALRSAAFDVEYEDDTFFFTVYGYGHGAGLSQHGANELAKRGMAFGEIIEYFYTGAAVGEYAA